MSLVARFQQPGLDDDTDGIPVHQFAAALRLWSRGKTTRGNVISTFAISVAEEAQLDLIKANYLGKAAGIDRADYLSDVESAQFLLEGGTITLAQAESIIEL
jgi:hypothetical protein